MKISKNNPINLPNIEEVNFGIENGLVVDIPFSDSIEPIIYNEIFYDDREYSTTTDYGFGVSKNIRYEDLFKKHGLQYGDYVNMVCEVKVDQVRKDSGGDCRPFIWSNSDQLTWIGTSMSKGTSNTEWTQINLHTQIVDGEFGRDGQGPFKIDYIRFQAHNYPNSNKNGTSYIRNLSIYISKGGPLKLSMLKRKPVSENIVLTKEGAFFGKNRVNLITNGCHENGDKIDFENGSFGLVGIKELNNPMSNISNKVMAMQDYSQYNIKISNMKPNTKYTLTGWVGYDSGYVGHKHFSHVRTYKVDDTESQVTSASPQETTDVVYIDGIRWEKYIYKFTTNSNELREVNSMNWYIGWYGTVDSDRVLSDYSPLRYVTGISLSEGIYGNDGYSNGAIGMSKYSLGTVENILNLNEHSVFGDIKLSESVSGQFGMMFSVSPAFYCGVNTDGNFIVSLVDGSRTQVVNIYSSKLEYNKKYNIGYTYKNNTLKMYMNGKLVKTATVNGISYNRADSEVKNIYVGTYTNGSTCPLNGYLTNFKIYKRELGENEVASVSSKFRTKSNITETSGVNEYINSEVDYKLYFPLDSEYDISKKHTIMQSTISPKDKRTGIYTMKIGNQYLPVYINKGWVRVFRQNITDGFVKWNSIAETKWSYPNDPNHNLYSILQELEQFRCNDGKFIFKLRYPQHCGDNEDKCNIWKQTSNPTSEALVGYEPIKTTMTVQHWGGLEYNGSQCLCDGSVNTGLWYYTIGQVSDYSSKFPTWDSTKSNIVELWVQSDSVNNLIFDENGCWVGSEYENIVPNPVGSTSSKVTENQYGWDWSKHSDAYTTSNWYVGYNGGVSTPEVGYHAKWVKESMFNKNYVCVKHIDVDNRWLGVSANMSKTLSSMGIVSGDRFNISCYANTENNNKNIGLGHYHRLLSNNTSAWGNSRINAPVKENVWLRYGHAYTIDSDWDMNQASQIYCYGNVGGGYGTIKATGFQCTKGWFMRPFIIGKNGNGSLEINISKIITTSKWNSDFTILYWKKMVGTSGDNSGSNSDTLTGQTSCTFGKSVSSTTLYSFINNEQDVKRSDNIVDIHKNWDLIVFKKVGDKLHTWSLNSNFKNIHTVLNTSASDIVWNSGRINRIAESFPNAYYRGFMFFNRVLTDDEINKIYGRKAKIDKDGFHSLHGIMEV